MGRKSKIEIRELVPEGNGLTVTRTVRVLQRKYGNLYGWVGTNIDKLRKNAEDYHKALIAAAKLGEEEFKAHGESLGIKSASPSNKREIVEKAVDAVRKIKVKDITYTFNDADWGAMRRELSVKGDKIVLVVAGDIIAFIGK